MKNKRMVEHVAIIIGLQILLATPTMLASPAVGSFVQHHPGLAVYVGLATAIVSAIVAAIRKESSAEGDS